MAGRDAAYAEASQHACRCAPLAEHLQGLGASNLGVNSGDVLGDLLLCQPASTPTFTSCLGVLEITQATHADLHVDALCSLTLAPSLWTKADQHSQHLQRAKMHALAGCAANAVQHSKPRGQSE